MTKQRSLNLLLLVVLTILITSANSVVALAQGPNSQATKSADSKIDKLNFEVQLHVLVASNDVGEKPGIPPALEAVVKQLRPSLPYSNYQLAATFVNRVKDGGTLEIRGVVSAELFTKGLNLPTTQTFYEFTLFQVKLDPDDGTIQIPKFRFGLRVPIISGMSKAESNNPSYPIINYEPTGIQTEISLREGMPTVVGTMNTSRPNQALILIASVKRTQ